MSIDIPVNQVCEWHLNDLGYYDTACGNAHEFITDGPGENDYRFCPYCGKTLIETHQEPTP